MSFLAHALDYAEIGFSVIPDHAESSNRASNDSKASAHWADLEYIRRRVPVTDVARITGLSVASVRRWRLLQRGPKYSKIGTAVRYQPDDIFSWLKSRPTGGGK